MMSGWLLMALVLMHGFGGQIRSLLINQPLHVINTFDELAQPQSPIPILVKNYLPHEVLCGLRGTKPFHLGTCNRLQIYPSGWKMYTECLLKVVNGEMAFLEVTG